MVGKVLSQAPILSPVAFTVRLDGGPFSLESITTQDGWRADIRRPDGGVIILGHWLGSFVDGAVVSPPDLNALLDRGITPRELVLKGCGQFILLEVTRQRLRILTAKTMYPLYWTQSVSGDKLVFSHDPEHIGRHLATTPNISSQAVALQSQYYGNAFETIVPQVRLLSWGEELTIDPAGRTTEVYLSELLRDGDWTLRTEQEKVPYLDPMVRILAARGVKVVLMLTGGIDSTVLLLKLLAAGVDVLPVVITQRCGNRFTALNEIVQSARMAGAMGLSRRMVIADLNDDWMFQSGWKTGWHWCYAYFAVLKSIVEGLGEPCVVVDGAGDSIKEIGYRVLARRLLSHPVAHMRQAVHRLSFRESAIRRQLNNLRRPAMSEPGCGHPLASIVFSRYPCGKPGTDVFPLFPQLEEELTAYAKQAILGRTVGHDAVITDPGEFMMVARVLRLYMYFGGRTWTGASLTSPYIDALPWYALTTFTTRECLSGKHLMYKYFRQHTGVSHCRRVGWLHHEVSRKIPILSDLCPRRGLEELETGYGIRGASFDLTAARWFQAERSTQWLRQVVKTDVCLLDLLEAGPVREYHERLVAQMRDGTFVYPRHSQPAQIVNFLRLEMFLRRLLGRGLPGTRG